MHMHMQPCGLAASKSRPLVRVPCRRKPSASPLCPAACHARERGSSSVVHPIHMDPCACVHTSTIHQQESKFSQVKLSSASG